MAAMASEANKERTPTKSVGTGATILTDGNAQFSQFLAAVENVLSHCTVYHSPLHYCNTTRNMLMPEHVELPSPALSDSRIIIEVSP